MSEPVLTRAFEPADIGLAAQFLAARQQVLRETLSLLPPKFESRDACAEVVRSTMSFADGFAAEANGLLVGFLFAIRNLTSPTNGSARFAPERGSMMFAHGHAVAPGVEPYAVYNALFAALAERYLPDDIFDHVAHVPAGDLELDAAWKNLGFGRISAFAARTTQPPAKPCLPAERSHRNAGRHRLRLPDCGEWERVSRPSADFRARTLEPTTEAEVRAEFRKALADEGQAIFLGYAEGGPAGLLRVEPAKGSPLSVPEHSCYIGDTAVLAGSTSRRAGHGDA